LALLATVLSGAFFSWVHLQTFVPFLPFLYARCSRTSSLWIAALCGLILDLLGSHRLGAHMLAFSVVTLLFYGQKKHFYEEKPLALCLFTWMLSLFLTATLFLFTFLSDAPPLRWEWAVVDLIAMPCVDALYALIYFSGPMLLYAYVHKGGLRRFLHRLRRRKHDIQEL
jgi:rod shape-determining protein MreD